MLAHRQKYLHQISQLGISCGKRSFRKKQCEIIYTYEIEFTNRVEANWEKEKNSLVFEIVISYYFHVIAMNLRILRQCWKWKPPHKSTSHSRTIEICTSALCDVRKCHPALYWGNMIADICNHLFYLVHFSLWQLQTLHHTRTQPNI